MKPQNEPQKALHEALCEASEQENRAVAAVRLILGKICSFESSDRHRRGHDLQKNAKLKKSEAKSDQMKQHDRSKVGRSGPKSAQTLCFSVCERRHCFAHLARQVPSEALFGTDGSRQTRHRGKILAVLHYVLSSAL